MNINETEHSVILKHINAAVELYVYNKTPAVGDLEKIGNNLYNDLFGYRDSHPERPRNCPVKYSLTELFNDLKYGRTCVDQKYLQKCIEELLLNEIFDDDDRKMKIPEFINGSDLEFKDISTEKYREYVFPNSNKLLIKNPLFLHVSTSGGHRLFDAQSTAWYVQPKEGWSLKWKVDDGKPNFLL